MSLKDRFKLILDEIGGSVPTINSDDEAFEKRRFAFIERLVKQTMSDEDELKSYNGTLYHYTSSAGLLGILQSQKIWGTEASYLNDAQEVKYGLDLINCTLKEFLHDDRNWAKNLFEVAIKTIEERDNQEIYVACFCEKGDLLSQWKGYSRFGDGYAIGFPTSQLSKYQRKSPYFHIKFLPVIYDKNRQVEIVKTECHYILEYVETILNDFSSSKDFEPKQFQDRLLTTAGQCLGDYLIYESIRFKAKAFEEEHEWRAVYVSTPPLNDWEEMEKHLKFRVAGSHIVPYVELDVAPSAQKEVWFLSISEIIVGPKIDFLKAVRSIEMICKQKKCELPSIRPSNITLQ